MALLGAFRVNIGLAHTTEILETKDSIARKSAQSKEIKNKFVQHFKDRFSRKKDKKNSILNVWRRDLLLTSPSQERKP